MVAGAGAGRVAQRMDCSAVGAPARPPGHPAINQGGMETPGAKTLGTQTE